MIGAARESRWAPSPRDVFERVRRSLMNDDADGFANLFAPGGVMEFPFAGAEAGLPDILEGRDEIRRHVSAAMMRTRQVGRRILGYDDVVLHETTDPEVIIAEFDLHEEVRSTGQSYHLPHVQVFRIRDGEIVWLRDYFSSARLVESAQRMAESTKTHPSLAIVPRLGARSLHLNGLNIRTKESSSWNRESTQSKKAARL